MTVHSDAYDVLHVSRSAPWPEIRAAFRRLARRYHPDGTMPDRVRMVEINSAYERLEVEHGRRAGEASHGLPTRPPTSAGGASTPPSGPVPQRGPLMRRIMNARRIETPMLDFGQYAGWRIADIAEYDPGYLRWLSRHSSGIRYRPLIAELIGADPEIGRHPAFLSRSTESG